MAGWVRFARFRRQVDDRAMAVLSWQSPEDAYPERIANMREGRSHAMLNRVVEAKKSQGKSAHGAAPAPSLATMNASGSLVVPAIAFLELEPPDGFEPSTPALQVRHSGQLSYRGGVDSLYLTTSGACLRISSSLATRTPRGVRCRPRESATSSPASAAPVSMLPGAARLDLVQARNSSTITTCHPVGYWATSFLKMMARQLASMPMPPFAIANAEHTRTSETDESRPLIALLLR